MIGLPNSSYFPYDTLEAKVALPERFQPSQNLDDEKLAKKLATTKLSEPKAAHITVPHDAPSSVPLPAKIDLATALQYGQATGYPPLLSFLRQFTRENLHPNVPYLNGPEVILTCGSTDGFGKTLECLTNVWDPVKDWVSDREGVLCEEFAYMNAVQAILPRGLNIAPVKIDEEGMLASGPGGLEDVLGNWDTRKGKRPHLMYTVTIGQNPTSGTLSVERRKEIYKICQKYDVIIVEDDPYWYLQFSSAAEHQASIRGSTPPRPNIENYNLGDGKKSSGFKFLDSLIPSYLSVDTDGRVVRLDTFSKTVAPGCRLGWITAQPKIIERILRITETSTQQPSGFVQAVIAQTIMGPQHSDPKSLARAKKSGEADGWKVEGWVRWLEGLRGEYERRMNKMCSALETHRFTTKQQRFGSSSSFSDEDDEWAIVSKVPMYSFTWPRGGMFVWVNFHLESHPLFGHKDISNQRLSKALWIHLTRKPYRVLVAPGDMFSPTEEIQKEEGWKFARLCFAAIDEKEVGSAGERFAQACEAFWCLRRKRDIEEIEGGEVSPTQIQGEEVVNLGYIC